MLRKNRVFFQFEQEAVLLGFWPCAHCLREKYRQAFWVTRLPV
ncbi:hypothetical protein [Larkinella insperata]|nr:hypothetical protein [Larkinella insperata]